MVCAEGYHDHFTYNERVEVFISIKVDREKRIDRLMFLSVHGEHLWRRN
jgi:hypothetical protein